MGAVGSAGSGRLALAHTARTLPGVSWPSSVVRSIIEMAISSAHCLAVVLIDRLASMAARASAPTWSTPGSPCRNSRSEGPTRAGISTGALIGDSLLRPFSLTVATTRYATGPGLAVRPCPRAGRTIYLDSRGRAKSSRRIANHRDGSRVVVTVRHWPLRRHIDYSQAKPW